MTVRRRSRIFRGSWACGWTAALLAIASIPATDARAATGQRIDIPAATLPQAIAILSREAGVSIGAEGALPNVRTTAVRGRLTVGQALARLLSGTGYAARNVGGTAWRIERAPVTPRPARRPAPPAVAADPGGSAEIIVSASKRDASLASLPIAVSLFTPSEAEGSNPATGTARVASSSEGLTLTGLGPGRNRMFLRGVADGSFNGESQTTVAVLLDGSRLTYSAPDPDIRLVDVKRVEVMKGPQGSLYGAGALGGIYHIVSNPADLDHFEGSVSGGMTAVSGGGVGPSGSIVVNAPLVRESIGLRLVGYASEEPGWIDTGPRRDSNRTRVTGGRATLGFVPREGWRLDLTGFVQLLDSRDSQYVYAPGARSRPAQIAEPHDNDLRHVAARLTYSGDINVELVNGATWHEVGDRLDATIGAEQFGLPNPRMLIDDRQYRVLDNELRVSGNHGPVRWLVGVSHVHATQDLATSIESPTASLLVDDDRRATTDLALFGDVAFPLVGTLSLDAGGRLFRTRVNETRIRSSGPEYGHIGRTGFTPSVALSWRPDADRLFFLRYGSATRQGGSDINANGHLDLLKDDELGSIEVGWRQRLGAGRIEAGAWYSTWEHIQSDMLESDGLIETRNAGRGRVFGAELSLQMPIGAGWRIDGGGGITSAELTRNDLGIELHDRRLPVVPDYTVRAGLARDFRLGGADASVMAQLRYVGPARLSFDPLVDRPMGNLLEGRVEGHVKLGAFTLTASVDNLFGEEDDGFAFGNALRFATMRQFIPMAPRRFTVGLARHF